MSFITELKRRNVFKVGVAYAIVAWLLMQITSIVAPALQLPDWTLSLIVFLIIIGFPLAVFLTWAYELTPEGIKPSKEIDKAESITHITGQKLNYTIIALLAFTVIFLVIDNYVLVDESQTASTEQIEQVTPATDAVEQSPTPIEEELQPEVLPNSVAVLPFENLSPNEEDAYFAAGIHEEILSQLAKIKDLNVIARTSVLKPDYVDGSMSIPVIADELNVETVMEGSVRYAGDKVRVTAQLIDGKTNTHLWTDTFDGDLTDIFRFQTEIAEQIAVATQAEFSLEERLRIDKQVTQSLEAYAQYLKARALVPDLRPDLPIEFYQYLDQAIAFDPNFALAHAVKATGFGLSIAYGVQINGLTFEAMERIALEHIERAMASDPDLGKNYMTQAYIHWSHQRGTPARQAFEHALQLRPNDVDILDDYARFLVFIGEHDEAIQLARRAILLAPNSASYHWLLGNSLWFAGNATAAESLRHAITLEPSLPMPHMLLGLIEISLGNESEASAELRIAEQLTDFSTAYYEQLTLLIHAYSRLGLREDAMRVFEQFNARVDAGEYITASALALAYLGIGKPDIAFDILYRNPNEGTISLHHIKTNILNDPVLETSRFAELRGRMGIIGGKSNQQIPPF